MERSQPFLNRDTGKCKWDMLFPHKKTDIKATKKVRKNN